MSLAIPSAKWEYDQCTDQISRVKTKVVNGQSFTATTKYQIDTNTLLGVASCLVRPLKPEVDGKIKAVKMGTTEYITLKQEHHISCQWPNKTMGLMIHSKAWLKIDWCEVLIMHKYDNSLCDIVETLTSDEKLEAITQISYGLVKLHELGIAHDDLKFANILYDKQKNRYDIADFGYAKFLKNIKSKEDRTKLINNDIQELKTMIRRILGGRVENKPCPTLVELYDMLPLMGYSLNLRKTILDTITNTRYGALEIAQRFREHN